MWLLYISRRSTLENYTLPFQLFTLLFISGYQAI